MGRRRRVGLSMLVAMALALVTPVIAVGAAPANPLVAGRPAVTQVAPPSLSSTDAPRQKPAASSTASDVPPDDLTTVDETAPAVIDPSTFTWTVDGAPAPVQFGQPDDVPAVVHPVAQDVAQIGVFRPSDGTWHTAQADTNVQWGQAGDVPEASHYAGIGNATTIAVYRPPSNKPFAQGRWYIKGTPSFNFGTQVDIPVPGSYYGTAADDWATQAAVFRPSTGQWFVRGNHANIQYGQNGDIPVPGDYDGNGTTDIAVYRPSTGTWFVRGQAAVHYGTAGDIPLTGDFTGDGHIDIAVYRPSTSTWFIRGQHSFTFGASGDTPVEAAPYHG